MGMKNKQLAKEIAERRMGMIAPLVGVLSSQEEYYEKRREISVMYEISTRTIQRYVDAYNEFGMDGLEPKGRVPEHKPYESTFIKLYANKPLSPCNKMTKPLILAFKPNSGT